jgi:hypothetical protein
MMDKVQNPVVLSVTIHRKSPLVYTQAQCASYFTLYSLIEKDMYIDKKTQEGIEFASIA